jgi:hypothetical protein
MDLFIGTIASNSFTGFITLPQPAIDARISGVNLVVTTNSVYIYNEQLSLVRQINSNQIPEIGLIFLALLSLMI